MYATATPDPDRLIALFTDGTGGFYDLSSHRRVPGVRLRLPFLPTFAGKSDRTLVIGHVGTIQGIDMITGALCHPTAHQHTEIYRIYADPAGNPLAQRRTRRHVPPHALRRCGRSGDP